MEVTGMHFIACSLVWSMPHTSYRNKPIRHALVDLLSSTGTTSALPSNYANEKAQENRNVEVCMMIQKGVIQA